MVKKVLLTLAAVAFVGVLAVYGYSIKDAKLNAEASGSPAVVSTFSATDVYATSAVLHGSANNNGGTAGMMWFEYGTSQNSLNMRTGDQFMFTSVTYPIHAKIANLSANTTYYFRLVTQNEAGNAYGSIQQFTTTNTAAPTASECASGTLTPDEAAQYAFATGSGNIQKIHIVSTIQGTEAVSVITNATNCALPVSQVTYKMYDNQLATQEFFDATPDANTVTVPAFGTYTLRTNLPSCMAQTDVYAGVGPHTLNNNNTTPGAATLMWVFSQNTGAKWPNDFRAVTNAAGNFCQKSYTATLKIVKTVDNSKGGTKQVSDFKLYQNGTQVISGEVKTYNFVGANDNKILTMTEDNLAGYTAGAWGGDCAADGKITLRPGENKTCTITNTYTQTTATCPNANGVLTLEQTKTAISQGKIRLTLVNDLTQVKAVSTIQNDTDCSLPVSQVTYKMFDQQLATQEMFDYAPSPVGSVLTVAAHSNGTLSTNLPSCMAQSDLYYGPGPTTLDNANNYPQGLRYVFYQNNASGYYNASGNFCQHAPTTATLKLVKTVVNDNGGTKQVSDFKLYQNGNQVTSGEVKTYTFNAGVTSINVTATEDNLPGYTAGSWGTDCAADGKITLHAGDVKTCTITNNDNPPAPATLKLIKIVKNDNGGTKTPSDFPLFVNTTRVYTGVENTFPAGTYTASEQNQTGYTAGTWTGDCAADGTVTLRAGEHKTCTIMNDDNPPVIQKGCIAITKEAYTWNDTRITPTPSFSFKLDGNQTYSTDANGNLMITDVPVGNHTIEEISQSGWTLQSITPALTNGVVTVGAGSNCANVLFKNKQVPPTLSGTCVASKSPAYINETITYTAVPVGGNGVYTYSWTGDDGLTGNATTTQKAYSTVGTKKARVTITSGNQTITTPDCQTEIQTATGGGFSISCAATPNNVLIGQNVTFSASATGGTGTYTYSWTGDENLSGNTATVVKSFGVIGNRTATVAVTSGGQTLTAQCNVNVSQPAIGCTSNCGSTPPPVTVTSTNNPGQVAGVFLSQVPYTGVTSNLKIALFMLALFSWSAWISYLIIKRKAKKSGVSMAQIFTGPTPVGPTLAFAGGPAPVAPQARIPVMPTMPRPEINAIPHEPKIEPKNFIKSPFIEHMAPKNEVKTETAVKEAPAPAAVKLPTDDTYEKLFAKVNAQASAPERVTKFEPVMVPVSTETTSIQVQKPQAEITLPSSTQDVIDTLEMKARELNTLVSADGLEIIAKASQNNKHNAGIILHHLVELYKGSEHEVDGDWMVLNGEKINKILFSTYITMTPVFIQWLAMGDERKTMSFVRMLQMQGQTVKDFVMNVVIELDKAYRFRVENMGDADATILDATMAWSNQELESVIHTLVTAVDQTYSSIYASVKIALVKVLDMSKTKSY